MLNNLKLNTMNYMDINSILINAGFPTNLDDETRILRYFANKNDIMVISVSKSFKEGNIASFIKGADDKLLCAYFIVNFL